jgi:hypothetical protein
MLGSGQYIDEYVTVRFEACAQFVADHAHGATGEVCAGCGWLSEEHPSAGAEVRALPSRRRDRSRAAA